MKAFSFSSSSEKAGHGSKSGRSCSSAPGMISSSLPSSDKSSVWSIPFSKANSSESSLSSTTIYGIYGQLAVNGGRVSIDMDTVSTCYGVRAANCTGDAVNVTGGDLSMSLTGINAYGVRANYCTGDILNVSGGTVDIYANGAAVGYALYSLTLSNGCYFADVPGGTVSLYGTNFAASGAINASTIEVAAEEDNYSEWDGETNLNNYPYILLTGSDNLEAYKQAAYDELQQFIDDNNIPYEIQMLDSFQRAIGKITFAIDNAETAEEVDELKAQGLRSFSDFVPEIHSVSVNKGNLVSKTLIPSKSTKYEVATVEILEEDGIDENGNWFVYWVDNYGNIVSTYSTYSFFVVEDRTLTACYVSPDSYWSVREKAIKVSEIVRTSDNEDGTVTLYAEHSASAAAVGNTILQHGIVWTTDSALGNAGSLTVNNTNVKKAAAVDTDTALTGLLRTTIKIGAGNTIYAIPYIIDAAGNATYGDMVTVKASDSISTLSVSGGTLETMLAQEEEIIPTAEDTPTVEEPEETSTISGIIMSIINAIFALIQTIISLF